MIFVSITPKLQEKPKKYVTFDPYWDRVGNDDKKARVNSS